MEIKFRFWANATVIYATIIYDDFVYILYMLRQTNSFLSTGHFDVGKVDPRYVFCFL